MNTLVIVESPSKANTIKSFLGKGYKVKASKGHVRDLPKSKLGIDIENDFEPQYINIRGKGDLINELRKEAKAADRVLLAADPDREGEAISWHLAAVLKLDPEKTKRITFNEITKSVVKEAIKSPRDINMNMVNSQQARRILDRLVGYQISPFLWKKIKNGLSAGRVQSVATRIIVEREEEIRAFVPEEYWNITAQLQNEKGETFTARYYGDENGKRDLHSESDVREVFVSMADTFRAVCDELVLNIGGYVTDDVDFDPNGKTYYACGPTPMMAAGAKKAEATGAKFYVSLEERMACGVGACLGCTVKTTQGNRRVCKDGPVFLSSEVLFHG